MATDKEYKVIASGPSGEQAFLGAVYASDDQIALINLGKLVRDKKDSLHPDTRVRLIDPDGSEIGAISTVAEHLIS